MRSAIALFLRVSVFLAVFLAACGGEPRLYSVGGLVIGLKGTLVLQNNGTDDLVVHADGPFTFPNKLPDDSAYNVTVKRAPTTQACVVSGGSSTIRGADVTNVLVGCADKTWHRPKDLDDRLSVAGTDAGDPQIALNEVGDAVVVWRQRDAAGNYQIYVAEYR